LETPKGKEQLEDLENLEILKSLIKISQVWFRNFTYIGCMYNEKTIILSL
jgi:hypothetical protein